MIHSQIRMLILATLFATSPLAIAQTTPMQMRATAATMPDPARWIQEDTTTAQKYVTSQKELSAAKFEALNACKLVMPTQQSNCVREANTIYQQDLIESRKRLYPAK